MTTTDRSGLRRVSIEASTLILVEGVDDLYFLKEFLAFCGIPDIQIEEVGGKDRFNKFLRLLLSEAPNSSQLRSLAVVRDADLDVAAAKTSCQFPVEGGGRRESRHPPIPSRIAHWGIGQGRHLGLEPRRVQPLARICPEALDGFNRWPGLGRHWYPDFPFQRDSHGSFSLHR